MKKLYFALSMMVWLLPLCAQEQPIGLVFKITSEEARFLYKESPSSVPESYFHTLVDSFSLSSTKHPNLTENGHYIYVSPNKERLDTRLESIHQHSLISFNNERDLMLRVLDRKGKAIQNAQLKLGQKKVRYEESIEGFRLKRRSKGGFLEVQLEGDTLFYTIERDNDRPLIARRYKRFSQTRFGFIVTSPIRWTKQTYHYFRRIIKWGDWRLPWRLWRRGQRNLNGYVVTQQPKYQVGDTLQVKAFVTTPKGRPIRKGVRLTVRNYQEPGPVLDTLIQPISPGAIVLDWPISDSLQLDRTYNLSLKYQKRQNLGQLTHRFTYEAYQLDEVVYDLHIPQDTFRQGEDFTLTASAKDRNELAVFDAQVKLHFIVDRLLSYHEQEMLIPDTLWSYETAMNQQGSAKINLPDSLFPPARMRIKVVAAFSNSNGELQEKVRSFHFSPLQDAISLTASNGVVKGIYYRNEQSLSTTALLITRQYYDDRADSLEVELPLEIPLSPDIYSYQLIGEKAKGRLVLQDNGSGSNTSQVNFEAIRQGDSLLLRLSNPNRLAISWLIRHAKGTLVEGFTKEAAFTWKQVDPGAKTYYLNYQYLWGGKAYQKEKEIIRYKKLLQVSIEQPQQVMPGQEVAVKVKVRDHKDRPVKHANLAVGAINAQFGSNDHIQTASIPYRKGLAPFYYNEFEPDASVYRGTNTLDRRWFNQLHLDHSLYYRLRFPEKGVYFQSDTITKDTFYQGIAQFAPYLVKNGKTVPIHLIYCNRKLVYYYDVSHSQPYSFIGNEGLNRITIRTTDEEITIDSIVLKKGHKLEFSIDLLHYPRWGKRHRISRRQMPKQFTYNEKQLIRSSILVLRNVPRNRSTFVWDAAHSIHLLSPTYRNKEIKVGPFTDGSRLWYKEKNGLETTFIFEAGFSYELARQRERLYAFELPIDKKKKLPNILSPPSPGQWIYAPSIHKRQETKFPFREYFGRRKQQELKGQYVFSYRHQRKNALQLILFQQNDTVRAIYRPLKRKIPALPIGTYQLTLVRADGYLHQREITISANTTLYQQLQQVDFRPDEQEFLSTIQLSFARPQISPQLPKQAGPNPYQSGMQRIAGYVTDEDGEPLIGASILIKGTSQGVVTDLDGYYEVVTSEPNPVLEISYTGFERQQIKARPGINDISLGASTMALDEVVVTGYGISNRRPRTVIQEDALSIRGSRSNAAGYYLEGKVAGVNISDGADPRTLVRGQSAGIIGDPLYIIDGKIGDPSQLNPSQIRSIKTLLGKEATAIYGASAANGVIIITTTGGPSLDFFQPNVAKGLRTSFRDFAYWNPNVITDEKGEATFKVTFPDNITAWNAYAVGMSTRNRSGLGFAQTQAFKPIIAQLAVPRFLTEGDTAALIGKSSNYTSDSIQVETRFLSADTVLSRQETWLQNGNVESTNVHAVMAGDSLAITYSLKALQATYEDGEKRKIPVFPKGTAEHTGHFLLLDQDTSLQLGFPANRGTVEVYIEKDILSVLLQEIDYLKNYKHGCNEQTASKLMALLLEKEIRAHLGERWEEEKLVDKCLQILAKNQNANGDWGWWNRSVGSDWVSRHVVKALLMAQQNGYGTPGLENALRTFTNEINTIPTSHLLANLRLLAEAQQDFPFQDYLPRIDTLPLSIHDRLQTIRIRQLAALPYTLDSLYHYRQQTIFGSHYWGEESFGLTQNKMSTALLAYQILQAANQPQQAQKAIQFFLERRRNTGRRHAWRNTMETALILRSILPQLLKEKGNLKDKAQLQLSGLYSASMDSFPQRFSLVPSEDSLQIEKTGAGTLYFTAFQSFWNSSPAKEGKAFQVDSRLEQDGQLVTQLKQGEKATLIVTVESKASAAYLMLQVPIPGACSYESKPNGRRGSEVHREYESHQTNIFIERLPPGKHEFKIDLEPRFSGTFQLNPAKIELMYFPTFYGREGMKVVGVK